MADWLERSIPVEIGCTARSGLRVDPAGADRAGPFIDAIEAVMPLAGDVARARGSDFVRCGVLRPPPAGGAKGFKDELGVSWRMSSAGPSPVEHPLAEAGLSDVAAHPFPPLPPDLQFADAAGMNTVLDAPTPGVVGTALALVGSWRFLEIFIDEPALASALLDWGAACARQHYAELLRRLPRAPDLVLYQDVVGTDQAPFFSESEFRRFVLPRLAGVVDVLRGLGAPRIGIMLRGATLPLLPLIADLGVEVIGIDHRARGMVAERVRGAVGREVVLHGTADLVALGACVARGDLRGTALLACELAEAMPVIAAPGGPMAEGELADAACGAAFLAALAPDELGDLARFGPVRAPIERAVERVRLLAREGALPGVSPDRLARPAVPAPARPHRARPPEGGARARAGTDPI
ncbi:uroporphyrinogen decarboxylase family protein [Ancylobacter mangrovi]|uniref:uroporphyrinogen decarboxylase family protein n=1 Tax=Ancylobacter mangrovi TaxID=2972472 RepID=UPI002161C005|nr:uroporphyrinogen decarboxylase family protein [Ancylobacter mangrovi]MCS0502909.1 hypothetical protein [Ancylobacter mangrovi]